MPVKKPTSDLVKKIKFIFPYKINPDAKFQRIQLEHDGLNAVLIKTPEVEVDGYATDLTNDALNIRCRYDSCDVVGQFIEAFNNRLVSEMSKRIEMLDCVKYSLDKMEAIKKLIRSPQANKVFYVRLQYLKPEKVYFVNYYNINKERVEVTKSNVYDIIDSNKRFEMVLALEQVYVTDINIYYKFRLHGLKECVSLTDQYEDYFSD